MQPILCSPLPSLYSDPTHSPLLALCSNHSELLLFLQTSRVIYIWPHVFLYSISLSEILSSLSPFWKPLWLFSSLPRQNNYTLFYASHCLVLLYSSGFICYMSLSSSVNRLSDLWQGRRHSHFSSSYSRNQGRPGIEVCFGLLQDSLSRTFPFQSLLSRVCNRSL